LGNSKTGGGEHGSKVVDVLTAGERHLILLRTLIGDHTTRTRHAVHHAMQRRCVWFERDGAAEPRRAFSEETANRSGGTRLDLGPGVFRVEGEGLVARRRGQRDGALLLALGFILLHAGATILKIVSKPPFQFLEPGLQPSITGG